MGYRQGKEFGMEYQTAEGRVGDIYEAYRRCIGISPEIRPSFDSVICRLAQPLNSTQMIRQFGL